MVVDYKLLGLGTQNLRLHVHELIYHISEDMF